MIRSLGPKLLVGITGLCLLHSAAGQQVEIVTPTFSNVITKSGDGLYQQLLAEAAERTGLSYTVRFYPIRRAWQYFSEHEDSCLLIYYDIMESRLGSRRVIPGYPFGAAKLHVFSRRGEPVISSVDELEGKTVAGVVDDISYYDSLVEEGISIDIAADYASSIRKIRAGRVDLMLAVLPDMVPFLGEFDYDPDYPISIFFDRMACHNTELGRSVTERISGALEAMKSEGFTQRIMGSQFIEFEY